MRIEEHNYTTMDRCDIIGLFWRQIPQNTYNYNRFFFRYQSAKMTSKALTVELVCPEVVINVPFRFNSDDAAIALKIVEAIEKFEL